MIPIFLTAGPNEVIVVSGFGYQKPALVNGGRILVFPGFHRWSRMSLNVMTLEIHSSGVFTKLGVPVNVTGVAQVKVASSPPELLLAACEHFLSKSEALIKVIIKETLEGHQRGIMGGMSVEQIYKDRKIFNERVFEITSKDLLNFGITIMSYTITNLTSDEHYLELLGMGRTAEVMKDARIGQAESNMYAKIKTAIANEELFKHKFENNTKIAESERAYQVNKYKFDTEVQTEKAIADLAYVLQEAITKQKIKEEEMQTKVVERTKQIELQEEEIKRKKVELEGLVMRPADFEKSRLEILAEADRKKQVMEAEALAESIKLKADAQQQAILVKAKAEYETMVMKAQAMKEYGKAAALEIYLQGLQNMAHNVANNVSKVNTIKMVSTDGSAIGALKLSNEIADITASIPNLVESMTGLKLKQMMESLK